jgi:RimJ/RimL family protein N-acetyltransferase
MGAGVGHYDVAEAQRYLETEGGRTNGQALVLVERDSGAVIGSAALLVPNPADGIPWIGLLILRADRQGRGLGREAATAIERRLARDGWAEVRLAVLATNPRARRFWERLGYRQVDGCWRAYDGRARAGATLGKVLRRRAVA